MKDRLANGIEVVCTGRGTHRPRALDQVLRDGVGRWTVASASGLSRGRRPGSGSRVAAREFRRETREKVPGSIGLVAVDNTITFACPVRQCGRSLSLRGNNFQARFDQLAAAGVSVLDLSLI